MGAARFDALGFSVLAWAQQAREGAGHREGGARSRVRRWWERGVGQGQGGGDTPAGSIHGTWGSRFLSPGKGSWARRSLACRGQEWVSQALGMAVLVGEGGFHRGHTCSYATGHTPTSGSSYRVRVSFLSGPGLRSRRKTGSAGGWGGAEVNQRSKGHRPPSSKMPFIQLNSPLRA